MATIKFTSTKLANKNKQGIIKPDSNGYYEIVIGGLNAVNSSGEYYVFAGAKQLFEESSSFMRRVKSGCLKGELGHPKKLPGMSNDEYLTRILSIEETNVCVHYSDVFLDTEYGKKNSEFNNPNLVAVIAKLKPSGIKADALTSSLENPKEDVCFSIRALTEDKYVQGRNNRTLVQIVTYDHVIEPGIAIARKWNSPSLEVLSDTPVSVPQLERIAEHTGMNNIAFESCLMAKETLKLLEVQINVPKLPRYAVW